MSRLLAIVAVNLTASCAIAQSDAESDTLASADEFAERLTFSGLIAAGFQAEFTGRTEEAGALTFRPSFDYAISEDTNAHVTLALSGGNGLNGVTRFNSGPWGADLEDDVENINGSDVDYLQTAWIAHGLDLGDGRLTVTGGWIDATEYIDQNEFANDEFVDFKNTIFLNAETAFIPSYTVGAVVEYELDDWVFTGVGTTVTENDDGNRYEYAALQAAKTVESSLGTGTYRVLATYATDSFLDAEGNSEESRFGLGLSVDQQLTDDIAVWGRAGWTDRAAAVDYETLLQGGLHFDGSMWRRPGDAAGIGYAWLNGGNTGIQTTHALEAYIRIALIDSLSLTLDAQYLYDNRTDGEDADGAVIGAFLVFEY